MKWDCFETKPAGRIHRKLPQLDSGLAVSCIELTEIDFKLLLNQFQLSVNPAGRLDFKTIPSQNTNVSLLMVCSSRAAAAPPPQSRRQGGRGSAMRRGPRGRRRRRRRQAASILTWHRPETSGPSGRPARNGVCRRGISVSKRMTLEAPGIHK